MNTTEKTRQLANKSLQLFGEVFGTKNVDLLDKMVAKDYIQHDPDCPDGLSGLKEFLSNIFKNAPEFILEPRGIFVDGDMAFSLSFQKYSKDHPGVFVIDLLRFENDMLVEHWVVNQEKKTSKYHQNEQIYNRK